MCGFVCFFQVRNESSIFAPTTRQQFLCCVSLSFCLWIRADALSFLVLLLYPRVAGLLVCCSNLLDVCSPLEYRQTRLPFCYRRKRFTTKRP